MKPLIISCSLNPESKSRILAKFLQKEIPDAELIDMREYPLPLCDGGEAYGHKLVPILKKKVEGASGIIIACPIYNYNTNAVIKNLAELLGDSWTNKVLAFVCAAGGKSSYMAPLHIMNILKFD